MLKVGGLREDLLTPWHRDQTPAFCWHTLLWPYTPYICLRLPPRHTLILILRTFTHCGRGAERLTGAGSSPTKVAQSSKRKWLHHNLWTCQVSFSFTHTDSQAHTSGCVNSVGVRPGAQLKPLSLWPLWNQDCPFIYHRPAGAPDELSSRL